MSCLAIARIARDHAVVVEEVNIAMSLVAHASS
jgi:hypothetical protein